MRSRHSLIAVVAAFLSSGACASVWQPTSLSGGRILALAPASSSESVMMAGTSTGLYISTDSGRSWRAKILAYDATGKIDFLEAIGFGAGPDGIVHVATSKGVFSVNGAAPFRVQRRRAAAGWTAGRMVGIRVFGRAGESAERAASSVIAIFERGLSRSDDGGETWSPWPTEDAVGFLRSVALGPDGKIYAAAERGLFRATWGSRDWEPVEVRGGAGVGRILFGPDRTLLVITGGDQPQLLARADQSAEWQPLPVPGLRDDSPILFLGPNLLVGTAAGVALYTARGAAPFGEGLASSVLSLSGTPEGDRLVAGTAGKGVWLFDLPIYSER